MLEHRTSHFNLNEQFGFLITIVLLVHPDVFVGYKYFPCNPWIASYEVHFNPSVVFLVIFVVIRVNKLGSLQSQFSVF